MKRTKKVKAVKKARRAQPNAQTRSKAARANIAEGTRSSLSLDGQRRRNS